MRAERARHFEAARQAVHRQPIPKGLPRYRTIGDCHANSARAVFADDRLTYVEGVALSARLGIWFGHAWVSIDHVHAIDLTWRGQYVRGSARNKKRNAVSERR